MIRKQEIIDVLIDNGMSIIECNSTTDNKKTFECAIVDIQEKAWWEGSARKVSHWIFVPSTKVICYNNGGRYLCNGVKVGKNTRKNEIFSAPNKIKCKKCLVKSRRIDTYEIIEHSGML